MIVLGDAGINYWEDSRDFKLKKRLEKLPITFLFIYGNHEIRPIHIDGYEEELWHKGIVYVESKYPSLKFAKDGEIFNFNGKTALVMGGAYSVDKWFRLGSGLLWQDDEQPRKEDYENMKKNLEKYANKVDYILTHTCPLRFVPSEALCTEIDQDTVDKNTENKFDRLYSSVSFKKWYCGHFHIDKDISNVHFIFKRIYTF